MAFFCYQEMVGKMQSLIEFQNHHDEQNFNTVKLQKMLNFAK